MEITDFNGNGEWSLSAIRARYREYARELGVSPLLDMSPQTYECGNRRWIYPLMEKVIEGIEHGDPACAEIGVEFIEQDRKFRFGRSLKARTARALRRTELTPLQIERIRNRVVHLLLVEQIAREYREYAKLLRQVGIGDFWPIIEEQVNRDNPHVLRYYQYFKSYALPGIDQKP